MNKRVVTVLMAILVFSAANRAAAQNRPAFAVDLAGGWVGFADDGIVNETMVGGAGRWYLRPRLSVGPEVIYINGNNHSHLMLTGNVMFDVFPATNGRPARVTPYVVGGVGMFQTRETLFTGDFTSTEGAFTAGGGVRAFVADRQSVGVEARMGWETHIRLNGVVGFTFGR